LNDESRNNETEESKNVVKELIDNLQKYREKYDTLIPPKQIADGLVLLRKALDKKIPEKILDRNLLIATWNIKQFSDLTEKWFGGENDKPKRNLHFITCIAEIISRFDIVALQEVKGNLNALKHLLKILGNHWDVILSDVNKGDPGNSERLAFVYDSRKVQLSGLACEIVIPKDKIQDYAMDEQFDRTPYAIGFRVNNTTFTLVTLHVKWGKTTKPELRIPEIETIAQWLSEWVNDKNAWDRNLITLGDFNIDKPGSELYNAFLKTGLFIPEKLYKPKRNLGKKDGFYDQIAWFKGDRKTPGLSFTFNDGGNFIFDTVIRKYMPELTKEDIKHRMSDHYPLWVEFLVE